MDSLNARDGDEDQPSVNALAAGLGCLVGPALRKCCASVETAKKSQQSLEEHVLKLTSELDKMLEDTPLPMLSQHAARLASVHKRVISLTASLKLIQGQIYSINTLIDSHESEKADTRGATSALPDCTSSASPVPVAQPLSDTWTFLRTTVVQDISTNKAVPDRPMAVVTQKTLSELLMHLNVFNVD